MRLEKNDWQLTKLKLHSHPPPIPKLIFGLMKPMFCIFQQAINLIAYFWPFFKVFFDLWVIGIESYFWQINVQRWSPRGRPWPRGRPRGHILKSLALASRPQVLENWPVLGSKTAVFFELLKFCGAVEKFFVKRFFVEIARKIFVKAFFLESTSACVLGPWPWPQAFLSLASRESVLGKAVLGLGLGLFFWPWPQALCHRLHLC